LVKKRAKCNPALSIGAVLMKCLAAVDAKVRIGDWEADTVVGRPEDAFVSLVSKKLFTVVRRIINMPI
jgi:IS30 family transposase